MQNYWYNGMWCYGDIMFYTFNILEHFAECHQQKLLLCWRYFCCYDIIEKLVFVQVIPHFHSVQSILLSKGFILLVFSSVTCCISLTFSFFGSCIWSSIYIWDFGLNIVYTKMLLLPFMKKSYFTIYQFHSQSVRLRHFHTF